MQAIRLSCIRPVHCCPLSNTIPALNSQLFYIDRDLHAGCLALIINMEHQQHSNEPQGEQTRPGRCRLRRRRAGGGPAGWVGPRRDRHGGRYRLVTQHVRCCRLSRRLRQDRARSGDRSTHLRPSASRLHSGGTDDDRPSE